jgi:hypothetical protein
MTQATRATRATTSIRSSLPGRILFAAAIAAFGTLPLLHAASAAAPQLGPPWFFAGPVGTPILGAVLLLLALGLATRKPAPWAALGLAVVCFTTACILWLPQVIAAPRKPRAWTPTFELLALCGAALVLAGLLSADPRRAARADGRPGFLLRQASTMVLDGRLLFAISLPVWGVLHFLYAPGLATLLPAWIPFHLFWIYFFGVAMAAAAVAIATGVQAPLAATLLGAMYLLWFVTLHLPRCFAAPHNGDEWTSAFVALAMGGGSWLMAAVAAAAARRRLAPES